MFHHDIMQSIMHERGRELRARAAAERDARLVRRAREFWADRAERFAVRRKVQSTCRRGAAPVG
ncbi:hypothetical protein [Actinomadura chokoriensis]|uniref:Uncharacterized protein n=1 Tax=Actinomadura chokoriensis TaxID=454156 RepID=A0ABV4R6Z0_9ACTN